MKRIFCLLLPFALSAACAATEPPLPSDFFAAALGKLEDSADVRELSPDTFEIRQRLQGPRTPQELNFMAFCMASALAQRRGFAGWSMSMTPPPKVTDPATRVLTVALLNDAGEAERLPAAAQRTEFATYGEFRPACGHVVNPTHLWPQD